VTLESLLTVFRALNEAEVRFMVVGGVAVNLHGYARATQDLDLVVELTTDNAVAAVRALGALGYKPQVPADIEEFADREKRRTWIEDKGMKVFSLISDSHRDTTVDIFVTEPFPFDEEYRIADVYDLGSGVEVRTVRPEALIEMKRAVDRDRDRDDIQHLRWILEERGKGGGHE